MMRLTAVGDKKQPIFYTRLGLKGEGDEGGIKGREFE
jgi:hypothetical protein